MLVLSSVMAFYTRNHPSAFADAKIVGLAVSLCWSFSQCWHFLAVQRNYCWCHWGGNHVCSKRQPIWILHFYFSGNFAVFLLYVHNITMAQSLWGLRIRQTPRRKRAPRFTRNAPKSYVCFIHRRWNVWRNCWNEHHRFLNVASKAQDSQGCIDVP